MMENNTSIAAEEPPDTLTNLCWETTTSIRGLRLKYPLTFLYNINQQDTTSILNRIVNKYTYQDSFEKCIGILTQTLYGATENYDPEGILGTLCASFMCFLGLQVNSVIYYFVISYSIVNLRPLTDLIYHDLYKRLPLTSSGWKNRAVS